MAMEWLRKIMEGKPLTEGDALEAKREMEGQFASIVKSQDAQDSEGHRTTDDDFRFFESEVKRWRNLFGLSGWELTVLHEEHCESNGRGCAAMCETDYESRMAIVTLARDWGPMETTRDNIAATALHEVLHMVLAPLKLIALARAATWAEIVGAEHEVLNVIQNFITDNAAAVSAPASNEQ